ncbi:MAG TPA: hypothetical protein VGS06_41625 [Streptosporangiaceae bacterium]|nr:hypothetical protein [Streptosporangiaceae bacterium]
MTEQRELAVARMICFSRAGGSRPGRDGRRGTNEQVAALYADHRDHHTRAAAHPAPPPEPGTRRPGGSRAGA